MTPSAPRPIPDPVSVDANLEAAARRAAHAAHVALGSPLRAAVDAGLTAGQVTAAGVGTAGLAAVLTGAGSRRGASAVWAGAAALDALDGAVARAGGAGSHGRFDDRVADRVADALIAAGVVARELHHGRRVAAFAAAAAGLSAAVPSYVTAAAEADTLVTSRCGAGRLERSVLWGAAILMPSTTTAACTAAVVLSSHTSWRRWRSGRSTPR